MRRRWAPHWERERAGLEPFKRIFLKNYVRLTRCCKNNTIPVCPSPSFLQRQYLKTSTFLKLEYWHWNNTVNQTTDLTCFFFTNFYMHLYVLPWNFITCRDVWICVITATVRIHNCSITTKKLSHYTFVGRPSSQLCPPATTDLFSITTVLSFQGCSVMESCSM